MVVVEAIVLIVKRKEKCQRVVASRDSLVVVEAVVVDVKLK